jgi:hypothetical protein
MAGRRTNLALLGLLFAALATGVLAFGLGTERVRWVAVAHGALGLGILVLAPWKSLIVRRGLRRRRPGSAASVVLGVFVVATILSGIAHATGLLVPIGPTTAMQVHVGAALASISLGLWHVLARRVPLRGTDLSRRNLIRAGGLLGAAGLSYGAAEGVIRSMSLPGSARRFTGSHEVGSRRPGQMPVTQWLNDRVPIIEEGDWRLSVLGPQARDWSLGELGDFGDRIRATLDCTGGWYAEQVWQGVWLKRLIPNLDGVRSIVVTSVTGYRRRFPPRDLPRLFLATGAGGRALTPGHGYPARLVAPGRRGFWWVKWVSSIETGPAPWWWQSPFPLT